MTTTQNFLGIPVQGNIYSHGPKIVQKTKADLKAVLMPVLAHPTVEAIRWTQYTPYFNDGDTCVFGVNEPLFKLKGIPETAGDYEDGFVASGDGRYNSDVEKLLGKTEYDRTTNNWNVTVPPSDPQLVELLKSFESAVGSGEYEEVLLEAFGDHASITVTSAGITVDTYDHD